MNAPVAGVAPARIGLVGNPSDLYGGKVIACSLAEFATTVSIAPAEAWRLPPDGAELLLPTIRRFVDLTGDEARPGAVTITSTVPRQAGLAGSSAVVIALLRALATRAAITISPFDLASMALAVEVEDLGIVAGAQDRVAQAYEGLVVVDMADGLRPSSVNRLDRALLPPLVVAWSDEPGEMSGDVHAAVRARFIAGDPAVTAAVREWRALADAAEGAITGGDRAALAAAIDAGFDLRASLFDIAPVDQALVTLARSTGAAATQCGSGGSVVALAPDPTATDALRTTFADEGYGVLVV